MKILSLLIIFALIPSSLAFIDVHEIEGGTLTVEYPEEGMQGEKISTNIKVDLQDNSIVRMEMIFPTQQTFTCEQTSCDTTYEFVMGENPASLLLQLELEKPGANKQPPQISSVPDFYFVEAGSENTLLYLKYFTIIPKVPETIQITESSPILEDEIIYLVNEITSRELIEEVFDEEKNLAKENFVVTKSAELKSVDTELGRKIKTEWTIKIEPKENVKLAKNIYVYEEVPKEGAPTYNEIVNSSHKFTVLKEDPVIMWHFAEVDETVEISYETSKASITGAATVVTVEEVEKGSPLQVIFPIVLIPLIAGLIIYFAKFRKK